MYNLDSFPKNIENIESKNVLRALNETTRYVERMNESAKRLPNQNILINTLVLREAKESSEIENIITTYDELYTSLAIPNYSKESEKEVIGYREALLQGLSSMKSKGILSQVGVLEIQKEVVRNDQGIRKREGTVIRNDSTKEIIYTPPQSFDLIDKYLYNLLLEFNNPSIDIDPLIFVAFLHFQFECIHPFYDGNGRTGRILNVLYLMNRNIIDFPILYLSSVINKRKDEYYNHFKKMNQNEGFEEYALFFLEVITETAKETINIIDSFESMIKHVDNLLRNESGKAYNSELVNLLFIQGYTRIEYIEEGLNVGRITATKYIKTCMKLGILKEVKKGTNKLYINTFTQRIFQ